MLILIILCGLGAFLGGILRNFLARLNGNFALGTLSANLLGTFILGWATTTILLHDSGQQLTAFLSLGFCGGLTTFSTFAFEVVTYWQKAAYKTAVWYVLISFFGGLLCAYLGMLGGKF